MHSYDDMALKDASKGKKVREPASETSIRASN